MRFSAAVDRVAHLLLDFGFELRADFARGGFPILGARPRDLFIQRGAHARFGIGDAGLRGLLRFLEDRAFAARMASSRSAADASSNC